MKRFWLWWAFQTDTATIKFLIYGTLLVVVPVVVINVFHILWWIKAGYVVLFMALVVYGANKQYDERQKILRDRYK